MAKFQRIIKRSKTRAVSTNRAAYSVCTPRIRIVVSCRIAWRLSLSVRKWDARTPALRNQDVLLRVAHSAKKSNWCKHNERPTIGGEWQCCMWHSHLSSISSMTWYDDKRYSSLSVRPPIASKEVEMRNTPTIVFMSASQWWNLFVSVMVKWPIFVSVQQP